MQNAPEAGRQSLTPEQARAEVGREEGEAVPRATAVATMQIDVGGTKMEIATHVAWEPLSDPPYANLRGVPAGSKFIKILPVEGKSKLNDCALSLKQKRGLDLYFTPWAGDQDIGGLYVGGKQFVLASTEDVRTGEPSLRLVHEVEHGEVDQLVATREGGVPSLLSMEARAVPDGTGAHGTPSAHDISARGTKSFKKGVSADEMATYGGEVARLLSAARAEGTAGGRLAAAKDYAAIGYEVCGQVHELCGQALAATDAGHYQISPVTRTFMIHDEPRTVSYSVATVQFDSADGKVEMTVPLESPTLEALQNRLRQLSNGAKELEDAFANVYHEIGTQQDLNKLYDVARYLQALTRKLKYGDTPAPRIAPPQRAVEAAAQRRAAAAQRRAAANGSATEEAPRDAGTTEERSPDRVDVSTGTARVTELPGQGGASTTAPVATTARPKGRSSAIELGPPSGPARPIPPRVLTLHDELLPGQVRFVSDAQGAQEWRPYLDPRLFVVHDVPGGIEISRTEGPQLVDALMGGMSTVPASQRLLLSLQIDADAKALGVADEINALTLAGSVRDQQALSKYLWAARKSGDPAMVERIKNAKPGEPLDLTIPKKPSLLQRVLGRRTETDGRPTAASAPHGPGSFPTSEPSQAYARALAFHDQLTDGRPVFISKQDAEPWRPYLQPPLFKVEPANGGGIKVLRGDVPEGAGPGPHEAGRAEEEGSNARAREPQSDSKEPSGVAEPQVDARAPEPRSYKLPENTPQPVVRTVGDGELTLVWLHGLNDRPDSKLMSNMVDGLGQSGASAQVIAPWLRPVTVDNAGKATSQGSHTLPGALDRAEPIIEATEGPLVIVAHSWGFNVAKELARKYPDKVKALVLFAPAVKSLERYWARYSQFTGGGPLPADVEQIRAGLDKVEAHLRGQLAADPANAGLRFFLDLNTTLRSTLDFGLPNDTVEVPTLVFYSGTDELIQPPSTFTDFADANPGMVELQAVDGLDHNMRAPKGWTFQPSQPPSSIMASPNAGERPITDPAATKDAAAQMAGRTHDFLHNTVGGSKPAEAPPATAGPEASPAADLGGGGRLPAQARPEAPEHGSGDLGGDVVGADPQLRVGATYTLTNPTTGRAMKAEVVSINTNPYTKKTVAVVQFDDGERFKFAAERLALVGRPFPEQRAALKQLNQEAVELIREHLGLDASHIPVVSLRGETNNKPQNVNGPFLAAFRRGGRGYTQAQIGGFYRDGRAILSREESSFEVGVRVHELLHGMSQDFTRAANSAKVNWSPLVEGLTEYFTRQTTGQVPDPAHGYARFVEFARALAGAIGQERLKSIFFGKGDELYQELAAEVDRTPRRGTFNEMVFLLQDNSVRAISLLQPGSPAPTGPPISAETAGAVVAAAVPGYSATDRVTAVGNAYDVELHTHDGKRWLVRIDARTRQMTVHDDWLGFVDPPREWGRARAAAPEATPAAEAPPRTAGWSVPTSAAPVPAAPASEAFSAADRAWVARAGTRGRCFVIGDQDGALGTAMATPRRDGYFDVFVRGGDHMYILRPGSSQEIPLSPEQVVEVMRQQGYTGGPVRLLSSRAGRDANGPAQAIANLIQAPVIAPSDDISLPDGAIEQDPDSSRVPRWKKFTPSSQPAQSSYVPLENRSIMLGHSDLLSTNDQRVQPLDGIYDVFIHHNEKDGLNMKLTGAAGVDRAPVTLEQLLQFIRATGYRGGPIRLVACDVALFDIPQRLADAVQANVFANTGSPEVQFDGRMRSVDHDGAPAGTWQLFEPRRRAAGAPAPAASPSPREVGEPGAPRRVRSSQTGAGSSPGGLVHGDGPTPVADAQVAGAPAAEAGTEMARQMVLMNQERGAVRGGVHYSFNVKNQDWFTPDMEDGYANPKYWERTGDMQWTLRSGVSASEGVKAWLKGPTVADCASAIVALQLDAIRRTLGDAAFDARYGADGQEAPRQHRLKIDQVMPEGPDADFHGKTRAQREGRIGPEGNRNADPGDWYFYGNYSKYLFKHPAGFFRGENVLCVGSPDGRQLWTGLGLDPAMTETGLRNKMIHEYNLSRTDADRQYLDKLKAKHKGKLPPEYDEGAFPDRIDANAFDEDRPLEWDGVMYQGGFREGSGTTLDKDKLEAARHEAPAYTPDEALPAPADLPADAAPLVDSLRTSGELPLAYMPEEEATQRSLAQKPPDQYWQMVDHLARNPRTQPFESAQAGISIGGDRFANARGLLPMQPGREWYQADFGPPRQLNGLETRPIGRLFYSNDGLLFVSRDGNRTVKYVGRWKQAGDAVELKPRAKYEPPKPPPDPRAEAQTPNEPQLSPAELEAQHEAEAEVRRAIPGLREIEDTREVSGQLEVTAFVASGRRVSGGMTSYDKWTISVDPASGKIIRVKSPRGDEDVAPFQRSAEAGRQYQIAMERAREDGVPTPGIGAEDAGAIAAHAVPGFYALNSTVSAGHAWDVELHTQDGNRWFVRVSRNGEILTAQNDSRGFIDPATLRKEDPPASTPAPALATREPPAKPLSTMPADARERLRMPAGRHKISDVTQSSPAKDVNSMFAPWVDVDADVEAIHRGEAVEGRDDGGRTFVVHGRIYGIHDTPSGGGVQNLYPIRGEGILVLDRGAYKALGVYNKFGETAFAEQILDRMGVAAAQRASAREAWKVGHPAAAAADD
jgi:pimeloyl-ACP methyl ester carboxylesterase